jgi:hypothetical protein
MKNRYFSVKDVVLMAVFGCASSLTTLTTAFIPAPLPGIYAIIAIPVSTILILTVVRDSWKIWRRNFHSACKWSRIHASSRRPASSLDNNFWIVHQRLTHRLNSVSIKEEAKRIKTTHNNSWTCL